MDGEHLFMAVVLGVVLVMLGCAIWFINDVGDTIEKRFQDGDSYYIEGYLIDVEYVGGAFGYRARTVFFFNDSRVINVVDANQVSVELNAYVRLELQKSKDGELEYLIGVKTL